MWPILGRFGPQFITSFNVALGAGVLLALALVRRRLPGAPRAITHLLLSGMAALGGGRAAFVAGNWGYYGNRPGEIMLFWQGGYGFHGALIAGLLFFWLRPFADRARLADAFAPAIPLLAATGWLGCYLAGCAYGAPVGQGLLAADSPDAFGVLAVRYQSQMVGLLGSLLIAGAILVLQRRAGQAGAGRWFWAAMALTLAAHAAGTALRGDPMPHALGLRADLVLDILLAVMALLLFVRRRRRSHLPQPANYATIPPARETEET